jgi:hypothetical protein
MSYEDNQPDCIDYIQLAFRKGCNPVACGESGLRETFIRPWKRYESVKFLWDMPEEERVYLKRYLQGLKRCPVCKQEFNLYDTLINYCATNGQYAWFCHNCRKELHRVKWRCWHKIPAFKRTNQSSDTEGELYTCISSRNGSNINQLKDILGWSYGKTRGAAMRLQAQNLIRIEEIHDRSYKELVLSINEDYT